MGAYNVPPGLARMFAALDARVAVLERLRPEGVHLVGAAGEPAFQNGWINLDAARPAGFYRHQGRVYLQGIVKSGTMSTAIFTLPSGYWPMETGNTIIATISNDLFGAIYVTPSGVVTAYAGSNIYMSLEGLSFRHV